MMAENGNYNTDTYNSIASNPVGILKLQSGETMTNVFNGRVDLRLDIMKGLTFTTTNGVDYYDGKVIVSAPNEWGPRVVWAITILIV